MKLSRTRRLPQVANMEAFLAVARSRSMTAAADELCLTQGAVSRQILDLEKFVGTSLFSRGTRGLELTQAGQQLAEQLQPALAHLEDVFGAFRSTGRQVLNVSITPSFGLEIITRNISDFLDQHPQYLINFHTRVGEVDVEQEDGLDAAVVAGEPGAKGVDGELLCSTPCYPFISASLCSAAQAQDPAVLLRYKLIGQVRQSDAWPEYLQGLGLPYSPEMIGTNLSMLTGAAQAVVNGLGIALLPEYVAHKHVAAGEIRRIGSTPHHARNSSYFLVSRRSVRDRSIFQDFQAWLLALGQRIEATGSAEAAA